MRPNVTTESSDKTPPVDATPSAEQSDPIPPLQIVPPDSSGVVVPADGPFPRVLAALNYQNFCLLVSGALVHHIGWAMCIMTVQWLTFTLSHSELMLGIVSLAMGLATLLTLPLGGPLADHLNRRRLLMVTYAASAVLTLIAAVVLWVDKLNVWHLILLAGLTGMIHGIRFPTYNALIPSLVNRRDLPNAVALNTFQFQLSRVIGPIVAGLVLASAWGATGNFTLFSVSCAVMVVTLMKMRQVPPAPDMGTTLIGGLVHGLGYFYRRSDLVIMFVLITLAMGLIAPMVTLLPAFVEAHLGRTSQDYAILMTCSGLGAICGAGLHMVRNRVDNSPRRFVLPMAIMSASMIATGFCQNFLLMIPLMFISAFGFAELVVIYKSAIVTTTPDHLLGRISSYFTMAFHIGWPIGALVCGFMAEQFGLLHVYRAFGVALFVVVLVVVATTRSVSPASQPNPR